METTLMSDEKKRFMWNLAFSFTIAHRGAAFKAYYAIRSFITFHGIFMASGYDLGEYGNIWYEDEEVPWQSPESEQARNEKLASLVAKIQDIGVETLIGRIMDNYRW